MISSSRIKVRGSINEFQRDIIAEYVLTTQHVFPKDWDTQVRLMTELIGLYKEGFSPNEALSYLIEEGFLHVH